MYGCTSLADTRISLDRFLVDYIFIYQGDVELHLNPNEVQSVRYVTQHELRDMFVQAGKASLLGRAGRVSQ
jgi:isopentenyldiphosphate isomerase